ncbi:MAG: XRE family transcriptional regulator, partial [Sciscionella sp.]
TAIGRADGEMAHASSANDPTAYDATKHAGTTGDALYDLALGGRFVTEAEQRLSVAVAGYSDTRVRSRAMSGTKLASLTMATGDPREAAAIGSRALGDAGQIHSRRATDQLRALRALTEPHAHATEVDELRSRIGTLLATA